MVLIPKIIHQIWLGNNPMPTEWIDTVKKFAAKFGYEHKMWTETSVSAQLGMEEFPSIHAMYTTSMNELAGKADIIRLVALYKYGGIYIDADSVVMKPNKLNAFFNKNKAAVFFGWEELSRARSRKLNMTSPDGTPMKRLIANGLIGSVAKHPFIKCLLDALSAKGANTNTTSGAWKVTGPLFVTQVYNKQKAEIPDVHIYPMKLFYPIHWGGIKDPELHKKIKIPSQSMLFQYGYSTNGFADIFHKKNQTRRARRVLE